MNPGRAGGLSDHGQEHKVEDDMVGIRAEFDAFAYLLASRGLLPPLAVGLFGDGDQVNRFLWNPKSDIGILPQQYELLAFVLALGEGLPKLGSVVFREAVSAGIDGNFDSIILKIKPHVDPQEVKRLEVWLATRVQWKQLPALRIAESFGKIDRFLFRVGTMKEQQPD